MSENLKQGEQITIDEILSPGSWSGKMYPEPLVQTTAKTSAPSLRKPRELPTVTPQFLDLRTDFPGLVPGSSWQTGGVLPGAFTTLNFGEFPSVVVESRLSQILEDSPPPPLLFERESVPGDSEQGEKEKQGNSRNSEDGVRTVSFQERAGKPGGGKGLLCADERTGALSTLNIQGIATSSNGSIGG